MNIEFGGKKIKKDEIYHIEIFGMKPFKNSSRWMVSCWEKNKTKEAGEICVNEFFDNPNDALSRLQYLIDELKELK